MKATEKNSPSALFIVQVNKWLTLQSACEIFQGLPRIVRVVFNLVFLTNVLFKNSVNDITLNVTEHTLRGGAGLIQRVICVQQTLVAGRSNIAQKLLSDKKKNTKNHFIKHVGLSLFQTPNLTLVSEENRHRAQSGDKDKSNCWWVGCGYPLLVSRTI